MMKITMLGCSALVPLPERAETAVTLECAGHTVLFDCGEGTQSAARKAGVVVTTADMIALTHYHGDHIFGLPGLLQSMTMAGRTKPLIITGPEGLSEALKPILELVGWTSYEIKLMDLPEEGVMLCDLFEGMREKVRLAPFKTMHRIPSQGYTAEIQRAGKFMPQRAKELGVPQNMWGRLQKGEAVEANGVMVEPCMVVGEPRKGIKFAFTGDTAMCESVNAAAAGADLLICEATYGDNARRRTPLSADT